jgi:hypothetical protein
MKLKKTIHILAVVVTFVAASLFVVDAIAGIYLSKTVERRFGPRLLAIAEDPKLTYQTVGDFLKGLPAPRTLHKEIFSTRQLMQRLTCDGLVFMISVLIWGITKTTKSQHGDTPNTYSPSAQGVGGR